MSQNQNKPTNAFVAASWVALFAGIVSYVAGLWNTQLLLSERGFYFIALMYGLFSAVSIQKSVRDRQSNIPVSGIYYGISWVSVIIVIVLLVAGLYNSTLSASEKGFIGISFTLSLFAAIAVQKNTRDLSINEPTV